MAKIRVSKDIIAEPPTLQCERVNKQIHPSWKCLSVSVFPSQKSPKRDLYFATCVRQGYEQRPTLNDLEDISLVLS
jgi:hypothetical protein